MEWGMLYLLTCLHQLEKTNEMDLSPVWLLQNTDSRDGSACPGSEAAVAQVGDWTVQ